MELTVIITGVLFFTSLSSCIASVYYVKPSHDTKCPGNPCFTLSEYAHNASQYFTSNSTFDFLPGHHTLDRDIPIFNASNLSFIGEQNNTSQILSQVACTKPAFFNFTQVQEIKIDALGFRHCGKGTSLPRAFYFNNVDHFAIKDSLFEHSQGSSLLVSYSTGTIDSVSFLNNTAGQYGGAVLTWNSQLNVSYMWKC